MRRMLPAKSWRVDAVVRLFVSVFFCIYAGSLLAGLPQLEGRPGPANPGYYALLAGAMVSLGIATFLLLRPLRVETLRWRLFGIAVCFYAALMCGFMAQRIAGPIKDLNIPHMVLATLSFQGLSLFLVGWFVRDHETTWAQAFGLDVDTSKALNTGALIMVIFLPGAWLLQWISGQVLVMLGMDPMEQITVQALRLSESWPQRVSLAAVSIIIAPAAEELLFRGILYPAIRDFGYPRLAFVGTAVLFAAIHLNAMTFVPLLALALGLTWLYMRTGNLLAPIVAHAIFNAVNFIMLFWIGKGPV